MGISKIKGRSPQQGHICRDGEETKPVITMEWKHLIDNIIFDSLHHDLTPFEKFDVSKGSFKF